MKIFKKISLIIPILLLVLLCGAKDIRQSFNRMDIALVVADSTSLNTQFEKPIWNILTGAGHKVYLCDSDQLNDNSSEGARVWSDYDLVVIPNFVSCPVVDTTKKIGEVPVIVLEDSLWDDFGFIPASGASEPYLWIADYQNGRIVKTQWDGNNWSSFNVGNSRMPRSITHYNGVSGQDTSIYYLSFYRSGTACDTLFRTTWNYGSLSKFGSTGGNYAFKFNRPEQIASLRYGAADWVVVADRTNNRYVMSKWQATDSLNHWKKYVVRSTVFSAGTDGVTTFDAAAGNSRLFKNMMVGSPDSTDISSTAGYMWITNDNIFLANGQSGTNAKIWKFDKSLNRVDSLTSSKIGTPQAVWFDTLSSYIYWTDSNGHELKRAKFDGTSDGTLMDSCFATGTGTNQLNDPRGLAGYSKSLYSLSSLTSDDTVSVTTVVDSITSVFTSGYNKLYTSNGSISGIIADSLDSWNILVKDRSNTYATVVIDTINNQKRIAFGLYDVSKLTLTNFQAFPEGPFTDRVKSLPSGWELFCRSIGRLDAAEQDSIFTVGYYTNVSYGATKGDTSILSYLRTNMHRVPLISKYYGDSTYYNADGFGWETLDLTLFHQDVGFSGTTDSMKSVLIANNKPLLNFGISPYPYTYLFGTTYPTAASATFMNNDSVVASHPILDSLGYNIGDALNFYDSAYPISCGSAAYYVVDTTKFLTLIKGRFTTIAGDTALPIMVASKERYWVGILPFENTPNYMFREFSENLLNLWDESLYYVMSGSAVLPPSGVTATTLSSDSIIVTWTDNSTNETGFNVYLTPGGTYSGTDLLVSSVGAGVTADTIGGMWPPSGLFYFDVGSTSSMGGARSGVPDSAYTSPVQPAKPIVYALSDTSINVLLNGYLWYDLFNDTTLASNPQWYQPYGKWNVERGYNRLRSWNALDSTTLVGTGINTRYAAQFDSAEGAVISDSAGELDSTLDIGYSDVMFSSWLYPNQIVASMNRIFYTKEGVFLLKIDPGTLKIHSLFYSPVAGSIIWGSSSSMIAENSWSHIVGILDRSGKYYLFINGKYDSEFSVTALTDSNMAKDSNFQLGKLYDDYSFVGKMSDIRYYNFGLDGLTTTGTYGTNNLLIKLGTDTIYCQVSGEGLINRLYDYSGKSLDGTDWDNLYNANREEIISNGNFGSTSEWNFLSYGGGWSIASGKASITADGTFNAIIKSNVNFNHSLKPNCYYELIYTVLTNTLSGGIANNRIYSEGNPAYTIWSIDQNLPEAVGTHRIVLKTNSSANLRDFTFASHDSSSGGATSGLFEIDNVSLKELGEIAWWPLTETGYPDKFYDATDNNLDLSLSGNVLVSGAGFNTISSSLTNSKDVEFTLKFHMNDSLRLNKQWVKFYLMSSDSIGDDDGYCLYADSSLFRVYKQTNNVCVDTLVDTTYTGNYKWRTLKITQDFSCTPVDTTYIWSFYLDNNLMGTMTDSTYTTLNWFVMQASHRRQWFDTIWLKNLSPGANDSTYTEYAIEDSLTSKYLQTNHTMGNTPVWKTWEDWGGEDGVYIKMSPYTSKAIRITARAKK